MAKVAAEKLLSRSVYERRATPGFEPVPIHAADLEKIIRAGLAAPSAYNLQPWRFVVVRDPEQKKKLRQAAFNQAKVEEASAVIVACGDPQGWQDELEEILRIAKQHGFSDEQNEKTRKAVTRFFTWSESACRRSRPRPLASAVSSRRSAAPRRSGSAASSTSGRFA